MDPKQTAAALRRIAARIEKDPKPSKQRTASQLSWVIATVTGGRTAKKSMTMGKMPSKKDFEEAAEEHLPYPMTLRGADAKAAMEVEGGSGSTFTKTYKDADDLYDFVKGLVAVWDKGDDEELGDDAISLGSSIMGTLGFEWI